MLGGSTCWNSTLGYYYYRDGQQPTSTQDLNIIMLFPNTQDGQWVRLNNRSFGDNIGVKRGDAVQLKYYPNIADPSRRLEGATTIFPEGTRSKGPVMNEFKPGALRAAIKAGTPIVPYAIDGSYKLYDQTRRVTKGKVKLSILPPVDPKALGMKHAELSQYVQSLIQAELDRMRAEDAEAKA